MMQNGSTWYYQYDLYTQPLYTLQIAGQAGSKPMSQNLNLNESKCVQVPSPNRKDIGKTFGEKHEQRI